MFTDNSCVNYRKPKFLFRHVSSKWCASTRKCIGLRKSPWRLRTQQPSLVAEQGYRHIITTIITAALLISWLFVVRGPLDWLFLVLLGWSNVRWWLAVFFSSHTLGAEAWVCIPSFALPTRLPLETAASWRPVDWSCADPFEAMMTDRSDSYAAPVSSGSCTTLPRCNRRPTPSLIAERVCSRSSVASQMSTWVSWWRRRNSLMSYS